MKRKVFLPIAIVLLGVVFFSQCKKDDKCELKIVCCHHPNGDATVTETMSKAVITFDLSPYTHGQVNPFISQFTVDGLDDWTAEQLYEWIEGGCVLYKEVPNNDKIKYYYPGITDENGVFNYFFPDPAEFIINAIKVDTIKNANGDIIQYKTYTGTLSSLQVTRDAIKTVPDTLWMDIVN